MVARTHIEPGKRPGPILIAGADRSGTSLMYALLASHPDISMVRRTNMWRWFDQRYGDLRDPANLDRCLEDLLRYARVGRLAPDVARLRREFLAGEASYGRLFSLIHEQHAERAGKSRWGDKSLHTEHHVEAVLRDLPSARIIQMVRDPRDRYASIVKRYDDRSKGIGAATGRWLASSAALARNQRRFPDNVTTVHYESLACDPEGTLRAVCGFIDAFYSPRMLRMEGAPDHGGTGGNSSFSRFEPGTISTRSIGRYREVLSARDLAFIQAAAGRRMREFGYELATVGWPTATERASFYLAALPANGARLAGWLTWEQLRGRRDSIPSVRLEPVA